MIRGKVDFGLQDVAKTEQVLYVISKSWVGYRTLQSALEQGSAVAEGTWFPAPYVKLGPDYRNLGVL